MFQISCLFGDVRTREYKIWRETGGEGEQDSNYESSENRKELSEEESKVHDGVMAEMASCMAGNRPEIKKEPGTKGPEDETDKVFEPDVFAHQKTLDSLLIKPKILKNFVGAELTELKRIFQECEEVTGDREKRMVFECHKDATLLIPKVAKVFRGIEDVIVKGSDKFSEGQLQVLAKKVVTVHDEFLECQVWFESLNTGRKKSKKN